MKRNLLTLVFITLVSLTAGAQAVCESHKELPKRIDSEIVDIDPALFKTQRIQSAPVCKAMDDDSYLSKQKHLCVQGADTPYIEGTEKLKPTIKLKDDDGEIAVLPFIICLF